MIKPLVRLEQWVKSGNRLMGCVYDHPRFPDGEFVRTSDIIDGYEPHEGERIQTTNTVYQLGEHA